MSTTAVAVEDVAKRFRVYHERNQSLKIALMRRRRASYEEFWALQDVNLEIPEGRTFGLVGHNGSGKSTLLKCMARILVPDRGRIEVNGKVSALLELGAGFHPELSGRDNIYLNGAILGLTKRDIDARFDDIVGFAGLESFIDQPVKNYSSGMYVRLGFSVAINVDPDVLMVDEVLAVGDEEFQRRCMEKFKDFKDEGRTIVVVSHALGTMRDLCDEVAWLDHGRVQRVGPPSDVVDNYIDTTHSERPDLISKGEMTRHGTGEVVLTGISMLKDGRETSQVRTGDRLTLRLQYEASTDVDDVVIGIGIHTITGQHVTGPNTRDGGIRLDVTKGVGAIDYTIPHLPLLPGTYDVATGITDSTLIDVFDHRRRSLRFDVLPGESAERLGFVTLGGSWTVGSET